MTTPAPPAGPGLGEEAYDEILARIREPGAYVEQPHRYRAVWQAAAIAKYVAALVAVAEQRGAAAERERIIGQLRQLPANDPHAHATARWIEMFGASR